jgi:ABC-type polysaccharide/polyol phosphate transport system ATPase subunit
MTINPAITVNALSKTYKLYHSHRDRVKEFIHPLRKLYHQKYHALKDISITLEHGEVLGIIGQNGSGKSTLLKILSSVVTPTSGSFKCEGRVTALLELGGGFNKDMTGIENIYFLGGIQGYPRKEMQKRLPEILKFADIGVYADQPVNNYSSGMYLRLAFSMAVNIDPNILIIDEALAVGDLRFQQKCYRKIKEFKDQGKTMLMCSHNLNAIRDFCTRAIWLHNGRIREEGDPFYVTDCYNSFMTSRVPAMAGEKTNNVNLNPNAGAALLATTVNSRSISWDMVESCESYGTGDALIHSVAMYHAEKHEKISFLTGGEKVRIYIQFVLLNNKPNPGILLIFNGQFGIPVFKINSFIFNQKLSFEVNTPTIATIDFTFPNLGNGNYSISLGIIEATKEAFQNLHWIHDAILVSVSNPDIRYKNGAQLALEKASVEVIQYEGSDNQ